MNGLAKIEVGPKHQAMLYSFAEISKKEVEARLAFTNLEPNIQLGVGSAVIHAVEGLAYKSLHDFDSLALLFDAIDVSIQNKVQEEFLATHPTHKEAFVVASRESVSESGDREYRCIIRSEIQDKDGGVLQICYAAVGPDFEVLHKITEKSTSELFKYKDAQVFNQEYVEVMRQILTRYLS